MRLFTRQQPLRAAVGAALAPAPELLLAKLDARFAAIEKKLDELTLWIGDQIVVSAQARISELLASPALADPKRLERHGFKGYSQQDEDGIIAEIFRRIGTTNRRFVECGVGTGLENNTLYLLCQGWSGVWIDASAQSCASIREKFAQPIASKQLTLIEDFIRTDNINSLIERSGIGAEVDLLSLDIDGNDYYVFEGLQALRPRAAVIEYNARFHPPVQLVQPYEAHRLWDGTDYGGASLAALAALAVHRGYRLVGTNLTGVNAFFVRDDLVQDLFCDNNDPAHLFNPARYRLIPGFDAGHRPNFGPYVTPEIPSHDP